MKRLSILFLFLSVITYAQIGVGSKELTNTIVLATFEELEYACGDLVLYYDIDADMVKKYSSVKVNEDRYVKEFGEYSLKPYSQGNSIYKKKEDCISINGIRYDYAKNGYYIEKREAYLICSGNTGVTYDTKGARHSETLRCGGGGEAKLDGSGRIVSWRWAGNPPMLISYNKDGKINSLALYHKYSIIYKNGALCEIKQTRYYTNEYASQDDADHYWYEIIERNNDGYWTVIDEYKTDSKVKIKTKRYTRIFN